MDVDFAAEGLLEGIDDGRARADRVALLEELLAQGVPLAELARAVTEERLALVRVERVFGTEQYTPREVAEMVGIDVELALRHRQALGLPRPGLDERVLTDSDLGALRPLKDFYAIGLPEDGMLEISRVLGEGLSRFAATLRPLVRERFLRPEIGEHELSTRYAAVAEHLGPQLAVVMQHILDLHLHEQIRNDAIGRAELATGQMAGATEVTVAFADLVGFTKLGERVPAEELGAIAGRLSELAGEVAHPPVRLVKTIGDAAMLVSPEAGPLVERVLELVDAADGEGDTFPRLRAGLATGPALGRAGDWYGAPVNLASRITNVARPGSVVAAATTREAAEGEPLRWSPLPPRRLKGVEGVVPLFRARRTDTPLT